MKKISRLSLLFISATALLSSVTQVYGQTICPVGQFASLCNLKADKAGSVIGSVVVIILILGVILALFFLIWGGIRWILSGGDKSKIDQARSTLIAAVVGLIIAFLAFFIVGVLLQIFTGQGLASLHIPTLVP